MYLGAARHLRAFEHLLDEINPSARPVEFIAQQLIGWTRGVTETAMHALAQNAGRFLARKGCAEFRTQFRLHRSQARVQATRIEDARRVERGFELMMHAHEDLA